MSKNAVERAALKEVTSNGNLEDGDIALLLQGLGNGVGGELPKDAYSGHPVRLL